MRRKFMEMRLTFFPLYFLPNCKHFKPLKLFYSHLPKVFSVGPTITTKCFRIGKLSVADKCFTLSRLSFVGTRKNGEERLLWVFS